MSAAAEPPMTPLPRIAAPSPEVFAREYVARSRPVILRGALDDWPAMRRWSYDYFRRRFGEREVTAVRARNGAMYDPESGLNYETIRLADYVDLLESGRPVDLYLVLRVHEAMPELFDDVVRPPYCRDVKWFRSKFFLGGYGTKGLLHRDLPENLYAQIFGRKRFVLLDRRETRRVHRHSFLSGVPNFSPVDVEAPDYARYPRFRGAPLWVADLEPGDLLYIPRLWWHSAHGLSHGASVNQWWVRGAMLPVVRTAEAVMRWRDLRL